MMTLAEFISYLPMDKNYTIRFLVNGVFGVEHKYLNTQNSNDLEVMDKYMSGNISGIDIDWVLKNITLELELWKHTYTAQYSHLMKS